MGGARGRLISADDRKEAIRLVEAAYARGARKYKACELLGISLRTMERWKKNNPHDKRKGVKRSIANKLSETEKTLILETVNSPEYCDLPACQIVPRLADNGIYIASESSIYRVLRAHKQLAHRQKSKKPKNKKPSPCIAYGPNQVWSWDISYLPSQVRGIYFYLYFILDIYSRKIVGWSIHEEQCSIHAANLIRQTCLDENIDQDQLTLHSDNGSPMRGATMIEMLNRLGVTPSFSRPSVSDDNPYLEALFKTVKYHPTYPSPKSFADIYVVRRWIISFVNWYNDQHLHSGLKFITPNQRHLGNDKKILEQRNNVYLQAQSKNPERWTGKTRDWNLPDIVTLNPNTKMQKTSHDQSEKMLIAI